MLLTIGLILALVSTFTEVKLVHGSTTIRKLYTHGVGPVEGIWFNTAGSFILSWLIGLLFAADGVTVLLGAALSTGLSQAYFSMEGWLESATGEPTISKSIAKARDRARPMISENTQIFKDLWKLIKFTIRVITFPIWGYRMGKEWCQANKEYIPWRR